jgi:transcription elongation factor Elf1
MAIKFKNCPVCQSRDGVVFCGLKKNHDGNYVNSYECIICGREWIEDIQREQIDEFRA